MDEPTYTRVQRWGIGVTSAAAVITLTLTVVSLLQALHLGA